MIFSKEEIDKITETLIDYNNEEFWILMETYLEWILDKVRKRGGGVDAEIKGDKL